MVHLDPRALPRGLVPTRRHEAPPRIERCGIDEDEEGDDHHGRPAAVGDIKMTGWRSSYREQHLTPCYLKGKCNFSTP